MRISRFVTAATALAALAGAASAQSVLVWATGNTGGDTPGIASWLFASGNFSSVDWTNDVNVPLSTLINYDRVLFFTNSSGDSDPTNGDVLADYADTGRRLVLGVFSWANQGGNTLGGRIITDEISPFVLDGSSLYVNANIGSTDGSSYWTGVNSITALFRDDVALTPDATLHGSWDDGEPLVASKGNVCAVNLFPDDSWGNVSGDLRPLFINALTVTVSGCPDPEECGDWDNSGGQSDGTDFFAYLDSFASGDSCADLVAPAGLDGNDFFAFLDRFVVPCP